MSILDLTYRQLSPLLLACMLCIALGGCTKEPAVAGPPTPAAGAAQLVPGDNSTAPFASSEGQEDSGASAGMAIEIGMPGKAFSADYAIRVGDSLVGNLTLDGHDDATVRLGDGTAATYPAVAFSVAQAGYPTWNGVLALQTLARLAAIEVSCSSTADAPPCPAEGYVLEIGDALDLPAYLGLGPFLGSELATGSTYAYQVWDPTGQVPINWRTTDAGQVDGRQCIQMESPPRPGAKTPFFLGPTSGTIVACHGLFLPQVVQLGNLRLNLQALTSTGRAESIAEDRSLPEFTSPHPCIVDWPAENTTLLPSNAYAAWAAGNDSEISAWLAAHPSAKLLPTAAHRFPPGSGLGISESYRIAGLALYYDEASGTVFPRGMSKTWKIVLMLPPSGQFQESSHIAQTASDVPKQSPVDCDGTLALFDAVETLHGRIEGHALSVFDILAPELGQSWQGSAPWLGPLTAARTEAGEDVASSWQPVDPWPLRAYVTYAPEGDSFGFLINAGADPSGWVRWFERSGWDP